MNKLKLFVENFFVYGVGGIISKIVPLVMVPIITRLMPDTSYFGISDLSNTIISLSSSLAVMGMYDAMYRMFFEKEDEDYKKNICSTALTFTLCTSMIVFVLLLIFKKQISTFFYGNQQYANMIYICAVATLVSATNSIVSAPTRMQNKRKVFLFTNIGSSILSYSISIPLIVNGYYIIALPLANVIAGISTEIIFGILNRKWFRIRRFNKLLLKQLLSIAVPLIPNFLIYWVFNSSDKIMITNILTVSDAGIYSVGAKLGMVSQLIYTAFSGGWQYFAFATMKEKNQVFTNSKVFEYLGIISFITTAFMCAWSYRIYNILFTGAYITGYIIAPYLFLAPLLQMLFQVACNQFIVIKKTWPNLFILSSGAVVNIILNWFLIPRIGIEGAAVATLIGYIISDVICCVVLVKMKLMILSFRFLLASISLVIYLVLWRVSFHQNGIWGTFFAVLETMWIVFLYRKDIHCLLLDIRGEYKK